MLIAPFRIVGFGSINHPLTDVMVQPLLVAPLPARQPFQSLSRPTTSRPCAFRCLSLKRCSYPRKLVSNLSNIFPFPSFTLGSNCNVSAPKINPNHLVRLGRFWGFIGQLDMDIEHPVPVLAQLSRSRFTPVQFASLIVSQYHRDTLSTTQQSQTNSSIFLPKVEDSGIVVGRSRSKLLDRFAFSLCRLPIGSNPSRNSDRLISTQPELRADVLINHALNRGFAGYSRLNLFIGVVTGIRKSLQQVIQFNGLLRTGLKLTNNGKSLFQALIISHVTYWRLSGHQTPQPPLLSLPMAEARGFSEVFR